MVFYLAAPLTLSGQPEGHKYNGLGSALLISATVREQHQASSVHLQSEPQNHKTLLLMILAWGVFNLDFGQLLVIEIL